MNVVDLKSGSVLAIPLDKDYGFAYCKLIFTKDIHPNYSENLIVKIYDSHTREKVDFFDKDF